MTAEDFKNLPAWQKIERRIMAALSEYHSDALGSVSSGKLDLIAVRTSYCAGAVDALIAVLKMPEQELAQNETAPNGAEKIPGEVMVGGEREIY